MSMEQILQQTGTVEALSRELGVDRATAEAGAAALLPAILSGFKNPVAAEAGQAPSAFSGLGGLGGLLSTIGGLGGGGLLDNVTSSEPTQIDKGNEILGQVFGSKEGSRAVAASAHGGGRRRDPPAAKRSGPTGRVEQDRRCGVVGHLDDGHANASSTASPTSRVDAWPPRSAIRPCACRSSATPPGRPRSATPSGPTP